jgi:chemotaxis protein methyltransferase CheR
VADATADTASGERRTPPPHEPGAPAIEEASDAPPPLAPLPPPAPRRGGDERGGAAADAGEAAGGARLAYGAGDYERAAALARRALAGARQADGGAAARDEEGMWIVLVRSLANLGRLAEAGEACAAALDRIVLSAELTYLHAVLLAQGGRHAESARAARRALYLDRRLVVAHLALGEALAALADAAGARRSFRNAAALLAAIPPDAPVPGADGEPAARLLAIARFRVRALGGAAPSAANLPRADAW